MKYNKLGTTNLEVSEICLGTMTFGEQNTEAEAHEQLSFALDNGVNFIDTAELYAVPSRKGNRGLTEKYIGTWIAKYQQRDKYILATKVTGPSPNLSYIAEDLGFSKKRISHAIDRSLAALQTDYVDLYQLHWPERNTNIFGSRGYVHKEDEQWQDNFAEVVQTMEELRVAGKIRYWGLSNENPWGIMRYLQEAEKLGLPKPVSNQNAYSLLNRLYEVGNAEISMREQMGLLAYSPLAMGILSGKYNKGTARAEARLNKYTYFSRYSSKNCLEATAKYIEIAENNGMSVTQLALAFVNQQPFVDSNIIGATTMDQLRENISSADIVLSSEVLKQISEVYQAIPNPAP